MNEQPTMVSILEFHLKSFLCTSLMYIPIRYMSLLRKIGCMVIIYSPQAMWTSVP